jgi:hypothetical protein
MKIWMKSVSTQSERELLTLTAIALILVFFFKPDQSSKFQQILSGSE